jgi:hypothetical protein
MGIILALLAIGFAAFLIWGFNEYWNTPGMGREGLFKKIGKKGY